MTSKSTNRPTHIIWQVIGEGEETIWNRVGAAWENKDKKGFSCRFDAYPVTGRTVIRINAERSSDEHGAPGQEI